ncbi:MAG: hypothetical protein NVS3B21_13640 [Acidimicrobiales bacterium]
MEAACAGRARAQQEDTEGDADAEDHRRRHYEANHLEMGGIPYKALTICGTSTRFDLGRYWVGTRIDDATLLRQIRMSSASSVIPVRADEHPADIAVAVETHRKAALSACEGQG